MEWNFSNLEISIVFNLSKIYSTEFFFLIFPVSSYVCNKKIYIYMSTYGVTGLVFKIDAIDGKKCVNRTVPPQFNLNTIRGTVESSLKKIA